MAIDWNEMLDGNFVKIEKDVPKDLRVISWKPQETFKDEHGEFRPGIVFDCSHEDGKDFSPAVKTWTVTSIRALIELRPIIEAAEAAGKKDIGLNIVKTGEGKGTRYTIKEV
jgi:hypothetical protein|tara:strand:- start:649 stop:984 length:336 start_codon:yes stop_codon:yes gene_type:complete